MPGSCYIQMLSCRQPFIRKSLGPGDQVHVAPRRLF